jgi:hypothetical protein
VGAEGPEDARVRLIDQFNLHLVALLAVLLVYRVANGDDYPKNAFYTGVYLCLGFIVINVSLRLNLSPATRFMSITLERLLWEYLGCAVVLLFFLTNLVG